MKFLAFTFPGPKKAVQCLCDCTAFPMTPALDAIIKGRDADQSGLIPVPGRPGWKVEGSADGHTSAALNLWRPGRPCLTSYLTYGRHLRSRLAGQYRLSRALRDVRSPVARVACRVLKKSFQFPVLFTFQCDPDQWETRPYPAEYDELILPLFAAAIESLYHQGVAG